MRSTHHTPFSPFISASAVALCLVACNPDGSPQQQLGEDRIVAGISSEGEVRIIYGVPSMVWEEEGGARTLEFVKGPAGHRTFMIQIGADGKVKSVEQVLKPSNFVKVVQGMSEDQVRRLLGAPGKKQAFGLSKEIGWYYRYLDGTDSRFFIVQFDNLKGSPTEGKVSKVLMMPDMEQGGNH
jgi:hypothetical protein